MKRFLLLVAAVTVLAGSAVSTSPAVAHAQASQAAARPTYAALGDSVAAGLGLPAVTHPAGDDIRCGRSYRAYTHQVAAAMNLQLVRGACSGATVGDLVTRQAVSGPNITAQLDTAFAGGTPRLVTITAGANDAHWQDFIRACYVTDCTTRASTLLANSYLVSLHAKLYTALSAIYLRSGGTPPTVVMTGYYDPLSTSCSRLQSNITPQEITWLAGETGALNQTVQDVSSHFSFVRFAPVSFVGHDICATTPWVQGVADRAPFHPTAAGQQVIARSVLHALGK